MKIGLITTGRIKVFDNQWVETRFWALGVPLIPIKSVFVIQGDKKKYLDIGINFQSVLKSCGSYWALIIGVVMLVVEESMLGAKGLPLGVVCFLGAGYVLFFLGKVSRQEKVDRTLFYHAVKINALPRYLNRRTAKELRDRLIGVLQKLMNNHSVNWLELAKSGNYNPKVLPILFAIMGYQCRLENRREYQQLYRQLRMHYLFVLSQN